MSLILKSVTSFRAVHTEGLEEEEIRKNEYRFQVSNYDGKGNLVSEESYLPEGDLEHKSTYTYNGLGQLIEEILLEGDEFISEHKTMEYDSEGRLLKEVLHYSDESFDETTISYDSFNRVIGRTTQSDEGEAGNRMVMEYESDLLIAEIEFDEENNIILEKRLEYDEKGNLISESLSSPEGTSKLTFEYDEAGNRSVTRRYDNEGRLVEKNSYSRDEQGRVKEVKEESRSGIEILRMEYDTNGNNTIQETVDSNDVAISRIERVYDVHNRIIQTRVNVAGSGQRPAQDYRIRFENEYYSE